MRRANKATTVLGLDIGGANLKAACLPSGQAVTRPFALWKDPAGLPAALGELAASLPAADSLAVTMTGELCDCWSSKRQGVHAILEATESIAAARPVMVWTNQGTFVDPVTARINPGAVASANWLATAVMAGRFAPKGTTLLVDIGTTTTDIIPLAEGQPIPRGRTDSERLAVGELVYRGWKRTPVCALGGLDLAAELFATMHDVFVILGQTAESTVDFDTADGRPASREAARARLARMYCLDPADCPAGELDLRAGDLADRLARQIAGEIDRVVAWQAKPIEAILVAGSGAFLLDRVLGWTGQSSLAQSGVVALAERWGEAGSTAACALAVATLAVEQAG